MRPAATARKRGLLAGACAPDWVRSRVLPVLILALLATACTADTAHTSSTFSTSQRTSTPDLSGELDDAQAKIADLQAQLDVVTEEVKTAQSEQDQLASDKATLEAEVEKAKAAVEDLMARYDPEIQAAIRAGNQSVIDIACETMDGTTVEESDGPMTERPSPAAGQQAHISDLRRSGNYLSPSSSRTRTEASSGTS